MLPTLAWLGYPTLPAWLLGAAVLVALAVDRWLGEPPVRWHPVVWMGHYLGCVGRWVQAHTRQSLSAASDYKAFWLGALVWIGGAALVLIVSCTLEQALLGALAVPVLEPGQGAWDQVGAGVLAALLLGAMLKPLLSWALLCSEVLAVEGALAQSLAAGRERLRWLVSRDVAALSEAQVRESAIETLAENFSDSVIAPLFWFVLLGLPGAALFRFANTADAMWGYRGLYPQDGQGQNWEWAGKWAARADDVLCWLPARITGMLLLAAAPQRWRQLRREAERTPSPNSGWPMAAMALALGVRLSKPGVYQLHAAGRAPTAHDAVRAQNLVSKVALALILIALAAIVLIVLCMGA